jgi:hypothetical protein
MVKMRVQVAPRASCLRGAACGQSSASEHARGKFSSSTSSLHDPCSLQGIIDRPSAAEPAGGQHVRVPLGAVTNSQFDFCKPFCAESGRRKWAPNRYAAANSVVETLCCGKRDQKLPNLPLKLVSYLHIQLMPSNIVSHIS